MHVVDIRHDCFTARGWLRACKYSRVLPYDSKIIVDLNLAQVYLILKIYYTLYNL